MDPVPGWIAPENPAIAGRPKYLGLPPVYAAVLLGSSGIVGISWQYLGAGAFLAAFGWLIGKAAMWWDPIFWSAFPQVIRIPSRLER